MLKDFRDVGHEKGGNSYVRKVSSAGQMSSDVMASNFRHEKKAPNVQWGAKLFIKSIMEMPQLKAIRIPRRGAVSFLP